MKLLKTNIYFHNKMQTDNKDLSKKILDKIECDKICPTPKWCFACKDYSLWFLVGACTLIMSLAFSLMVFLFISHDWEVYQLESGNLFLHVLVYTPYLWIIIFLLLILLVIYSFSRTKDGYKYNINKSVGVFISIILLLSLVLIFTGISSMLQDNLESRVPVYRSVVFDKNNIWDEPVKGLLSGQITEIKDPNNFEIKDFDASFWQIKLENTKIIPQTFVIKIGEKLKIVGKISGKNVFTASEIKPW